jgi:hypothetical protein
MAKGADNVRLDKGWKTVHSPKELENKEGVYKGGAAQSQPKTPPKVD